jgi:hypothetical protein
MLLPLLGLFILALQQTEANLGMYVLTMQYTAVKEWGHSARPQALFDVSSACTKSWLSAVYPTTSRHTTQVLHNMSVVV